MKKELTFFPSPTQCSRCENEIFRSEDKWKGPCAWASFRRPASDTYALAIDVVDNYNGYTCEVAEIFCKSCDLFIGHRFEDGVAKGDTHPDARYRH